MICSTREAGFKYIFKYITKGHDLANVSIAANVDAEGNTINHYDEIAHFEGLRSLSSIEAMDHIAGRKLFQKKIS
jgi:hypothetical protein